MEIEKYCGQQVIWIPIKDGFFPSDLLVQEQTGYRVAATPWHRIGENGLEKAYRLLDK